MKPVVHLVGAGRAGTALARLLHRAGHPLGRVVARDAERARAAVARLGAGEPSTDAASGFGDGAITLLGLPEHALAGESARLAARLAPLRDAIALHLSGALPAEVLAPLRERGIAIGSLHPLAAFADRDRPPEALAGVTFDVDGMPAARAAARALVQELGGRVIELEPGGKTLLHAGACVASNAMVALLDLACRLAERAGATPDEARAAMSALAAGTLANFERAGAAALTGPIERGETEVIARHVDALARAPGERTLYVALARATLDVARRNGTLGRDAIAQLERLLDAAS